MNPRTVVYALLGFGIARILSPTSSKHSEQTGRLISAPSSYVREKLFDPDVALAISKLLRRQDYFFPISIAEELKDSPTAALARIQYARSLEETHAGMGTGDVVVDADSVVQITAHTGSLWKGQRMRYNIVLSDLQTRNGNDTYAALEYTKTWQGMYVLKLLHRRKWLRDYVGEGYGDPIDASSLDLFQTLVGDLWSGKRLNLTALEPVQRTTSGRSLD